MRCTHPLGLIAIFLLALQAAIAQTPAPPTQSDTGANKNSATAGSTASAGNNAGGASSDPATQDSNTGDPLLDVPPMPKGKITLIGGSVAKIDPIRNRMVLEPFGMKDKMKVFFDERTHIYHDGRETTQAAIHKGDRVYVDTMLDGPHVFALSIRVSSQGGASEASGQVVSFNSGSGIMTLRDQLSKSPISFQVNPQTVIKLRDGKSASMAELSAGSLVAARLTAGPQRREIAQEIQVIATPGTSFSFAGKLTNVDLRNGMIAVENQTDDQIYDISFDPKTSEVRHQLKVGTLVQVVATFTGKGYKADSLTLQQ